MKNTNKKICILLGIILVIFLVAIVSLSIIINGDKICKNTYVNNINIGNLTKEQAIEKLDDVYKLNNIEFKYKDKQFKISPNEIIYRFRKVAQLVPTTENLKYGKKPHPDATDHWFDAAKAADGEDWVEMVKSVAGGGKKGSIID